MMTDHEGGGSYVRQPDGSLQLVSRTEEPKPAVPEPDAATAAPGQTAPAVVASDAPVTEETSAVTSDEPVPTTRKRNP
ncbi:hypothetical protein [Rhizobium sp. 9140]|uniref:hypothetical protein n=1 Tax=Rhizobium sp. 9140 TaxID=1761900 RepID=UPI000798800E|nr:hypothetical protein [Rhizobium sp. 9140]CZT36416.1 hypothetical protein GA0004734_00034150 [Rhizobium sp. 9140]